MRRKIYDLIYVDLNDGQNGAVVEDISESGLMLESALRISEEQVSRLRFELPGSKEPVEGHGKLVWNSASGKQAGVEFVGLAEYDRARIAEYVMKEDAGGFPAAILEETIPKERVERAPIAKPAAPARLPPAGRRSGNAAAFRGPFGPQPQPEARPSGNFPGGSASWQRAGERAAASPPGSARQKEHAPGYRRWPQGEGRPQPAENRRPADEANLPWWGLGRAMLWIVVIFVAAFLGFQYHEELLQSSTAGGSGPTANLPPGATGFARSPSANAAASGVEPGQSPPMTPQTQSPAAAPNAQNGSAAASAAMGGQAAELGGMQTQTLAAEAAAASPPNIRRQTRGLAGGQYSRQAGYGPGGMAAQGNDPDHDVLLVGAPPAGAAPRRVILESSPVSASSFIAVTMTRSMLVSGSDESTERVQLGKLISYIEPNYPNPALEREVQGLVTVRAFVDPEGDVNRVRLVSGSSVLAPAAMAAIGAWRFGSTLINGQPVESQADVSVYFRLH